MHGVLTALATPFLKGEIDWASLERLLTQQESQSISGYIVAGTTGEAPTLSLKEIESLYRFVRQRTKKPVLVGTGTNSTQSTVERTKLAKSWGADAALVVTPYYNRPNQEGLLVHYEKVAAETRFPLVMYDVPARTGVRLGLETVQRLADHPDVVALKDATGDLDHHKKLLESCKGKLSLLSGDDPSCGDYINMGGDGVISVCSHLIGSSMIELWNNNRDFSGWSRHGSILKGLSMQPNPIPLKMVLKWLGVFQSAELRPPLVELSEPDWPELKDLMSQGGVLK